MARRQEAFACVAGRSRLLVAGPGHPRRPGPRAGEIRAGCGQTRPWAGPGRPAVVTGRAATRGSVRAGEAPVPVCVVNRLFQAIGGELAGYHAGEAARMG